jgi:hypothetical protein
LRNVRTISYLKCVTAVIACLPEPSRLR